MKIFEQEQVMQCFKYLNPIDDDSDLKMFLFST